MIRNLLKKLTFFFWLAPGFLLWASFPPMGECKDAYLALAPLLWLVRQGDVKKSVVRWFLNGFLFWFATLAWMPAIVKNGGPWPLVVLGWGVLATYCALYFAAFGYLATKVWSWVRTRGYGWRLAALVIAEPVLWAGLEIVRARLFGGFAWNQLGVVAVNMGFGAPAQFGGVFLLSAVVGRQRRHPCRYRCPAGCGPSRRFCRSCSFSRSIRCRTIRVRKRRLRRTCGSRSCSAISRASSLGVRVRIRLRSIRICSRTSRS